MSAGLTRWWLKPAATERRRSSSCPQPVSAISEMWRLRGIGADAARDLVAVHAGHADVEQHDVGLERLDALERGAAAMGQRHFGAQHAQQHREALAAVAAVVDDQDAARRQRLDAARLARLAACVRPAAAAGR